MTYSQRLDIFCYWADFYGLKIIAPKYAHNDNDTTWANNYV